MPDGRAASVLIVEDHDLLAKAFALVLEREAIAVHVASNCDDGLAQADAYLPDVVVADFRMSPFNGLDFMTRLRQRKEHQRTGLVMVTGSTLDEATQSGLRALGAEIRWKPISLEDFLSVVRASLDSRRSA